MRPRFGAESRQHLTAVQHTSQGAGVGSGIRKRRAVRPGRYAQHFDLITDAIAAERQIKGWSRVKKEALIAGDFAGLRAAAKRKGSF